MKKTHTYTSLFFVLWLAVLMAGYVASRSSLFAGVGQNNCLPCTYCMDCNTVMAPLRDYGWVYDGSDTPGDYRLYGSDIVPGNGTIYGLIGYSECYDNMAGDTGYVLENVFYHNATFCSFTPGGGGIRDYCGNAGQGIAHTGSTLDQLSCVPL